MFKSLQKGMYFCQALIRTLTLFCSFSPYLQRFAVYFVGN